MEAKILDYIYDENKELIGVNLDQIGELKISHWEEKVIGSFARVEFKIPAKDGVFTKFIPERLRLYKNGEIQSMLPYWRHGVFVKSTKGEDVLVTRCYYHVDSKKTENSLPFGKTVIGTVEIRKATNAKTGEEKIILNFIYSGETKKIEKKRKIVIDSGSDKEPIFKTKIPGSGGKMIKVFNV
ncbi:MAG TPA: hypothetical protein PK686_01920 [bacterium]|nr:hypothetical protein [bacterium]HPV65425.1 hypothetical protein [bacterium]